MKATYYLLLLLICFCSCKEEEQKRIDPRAATDTLTVKYSSQKKSEIFITPTARQAISGWESFADLEQNIKTIDTSRLNYLRLNAKEYLDNAALIATKSRDTFINNAIKSRLIVVYSKTSTLLQEASKAVVDTAQINKEATELYNAFQNLKLQINLKWQKSIEELLEQYEIEADSLSAVRDSLRPGRSGNIRPIEN